MINEQTKLLRWIGWFFFGNAVLFCLIELKNLPFVIASEFPMLTLHGKWIESVFLCLLYIGYLPVLAFLPAVLVLLLVLLFPQRRLVFFVAICLASIAVNLLIIDAVIFQLYRFHLNGIIFHLALNDLSGQIFGFSTREYWVACVIFFGVTLIEIVYAFFIWAFVDKCKGYGKVALGFIGIGFYTSYAMIFFSNNQIINRILIDTTHFLPFYSETIALGIPNQNSLIAVERIGERNFLQPQQINALLHYPLQDLQCSEKKPLNLVVIVIDAWRFDALNSTVMPSLVQFSKKSALYTQHMSGGNATGPGIFSLFYGLPAMYWTAMEMQHRGPVLIDQLIKQNYQVGIFSSATLTLPAFDQTVFQQIKNIRAHTPGETPYARDRVITNEFKQFIEKAQKNSKPIFSFLFYDAVHSYCRYNEDLKPFQPVIKDCDRFMIGGTFDRNAYLNRYKNALLLTDKQVGEVINALQKNHLLENTVVVITGDHGEEFDDNHLGYLGHTSNYTRYQVQTPLIVYWPHEKASVFSHLTTHYDIVPTLMKKLFGCQAVFSSYSTGKELSDTSSRPYFVVNSYIGLGVIEPERITSIFQVGNFQIQQVNAKPIIEAKLNMDVMKQVFQDMTRFYAKNKDEKK